MAAKPAYQGSRNPRDAHKLVNGLLALALALVQRCHDAGLDHVRPVAPKVCLQISVHI